MALATNVHDLLFAAIESRYAEDGDIAQLVPNQLYRDFSPPEDDEKTKVAYPLVVVSQGQEGGFTEECITGDGVEPVDERYPINFEITASTSSEAAQIAWQIVHAFKGWTGDYPGVNIGATYRSAPPWVGAVEQGVCKASVDFIVSATAAEE